MNTKRYQKELVIGLIGTIILGMICCSATAMTAIPTVDSDPAMEPDHQQEKVQPKSVINQSWDKLTGNVTDAGWYVESESGREIFVFWVDGKEFHTISHGIASTVKAAIDHKPPQQVTVYYTGEQVHLVVRHTK